MSKTDIQSGTPRAFTSLRKTLFLEASILLTFAVLVTAVIAFFLAKSEVHTRTFAQLQSMVHAKEDLLESIVSLQREQVAALGRETDDMLSAGRLIGFESLFEVRDGNVTVLAGVKPSDGMLRQLETATDESHTAFVPVISSAGWKSYMISAPRVDRGGLTRGRLVAVFDAMPIIRQLLQADYLGMSADVSLGVRTGDELLLLHTLRNQQITAASPLHLGLMDDQLTKGLALAKAVQGMEGSERTKDYAGVTVLAAYRSMPSIGWGIVVQIDQFEVYAPLLQLGVRMGLLGVILVSLLSSIMFSLSRRIADPLYELTRKLHGLEAKRWRFVRSVFTRNEIEEVDIAAFDLTRRLREAHTHLEDIVRQRTQALQDQHAQDDAVFESIEYGLLVTDTDGNIVQMNQAAEDISGWTEDSVKGQPFDRVLPIQDKDGGGIPQSKHPVRRVLDTRNKYAPVTEQALSLVRKDGKTMPLLLRVTPILQGNRCSGTVTVFADITEARRVERLKSEFISLVSHQLRTPLTSIRWYLEMLAGKDMGALNDEQLNLVHEASDSNERMVRLVNALLNVSRIELGTMAMKVESVNLLDFSGQIMKSFELELNRKDMKVEYIADDKTLSVCSDPVLLRLVVENLCSNAIKYSPAKSIITITVKARTDAPGAAIAVTDRGIGIPLNQQRHIFEKLFRSTNAQSVDTDGNGLGMYISNLTAQTIGATLSFVSEENKGTTFVVTLPENPQRDDVAN